MLFPREVNLHVFSGGWQVPNLAHPKLSLLYGGKKYGGCYNRKESEPTQPYAQRVYCFWEKSGGVRRSVGRAPVRFIPLRDTRGKGIFYTRLENVSCEYFRLNGSRCFLVGSFDSTETRLIGPQISVDVSDVTPVTHGDD